MGRPGEKEAHGSVAKGMICKRKNNSRRKIKEIKMRRTGRKTAKEMMMIKTVCETRKCGNAKEVTRSRVAKRVMMRVCE